MLHPRDARAILAPLVALGLALPTPSGCAGSDAGECSSSAGPVAPEGSTIRVSGRALRADGSPLTGSVLLQDPPTLGDLVGALFTAGLSCLNEDLSGLDCSDYRRLDLDAEGGFSFTLPEADTRGALFDKSFYLLAAAPGDAPASAVMVATFRTATVALPDLQLWEQAPQVTTAGGEVTVTAGTPPEPACTALESHTVVFADAAGHTAWSQAPGAMDARILEDFEGQVWVRATYDTEGWGPRHGLHLSSAAAPFSSAAGAPPSRGAACTLGTTPAAAGACPLTDGGWEEQSLADGVATLDLGETRALSLLVLRGHLAGVELAVSEDGQAWTPLPATLTDAPAVIAPASGTTARFVRLTLPFDAAQGYQPVLSVSEISAW